MNDFREKALNRVLQTLKRHANVLPIKQHFDHAFGVLGIGVTLN